MNQITTRYITENGACYEQYVITDPEAKTALTITPERGGMITSFTLDGEEFVWTRRPNFNTGVIADGEKTIDEAAKDLLDLVIRVASGEQTKAEKHGFREISIFKDGVVL